jgi:pyroglutamyl-peptidase
MQALLTGFEGWAGKVNPSGKIAKALNGEKIGALTVTGKELPEDFYKLPAILRQLINKLKPDIVISTGWDYISKIKVEKVSLNVMNCIFGDKTIPDNSGNAPKGKDVIRGGPLSLEATIPAELIVNKLTKKHIPSYVSYHAGTHCCNDVMYSGVYYTQKVKPNSVAGFVHIPPVAEMKIKKLGVKQMTLERETQAIEIALETCRDYLESR